MNKYTNSTESKHISNLRTDYPNMSIPDGADLSDIGWYAIETVPLPTPVAGYIFIEGPPEQYEPGKWRQTWVQESPPKPSIADFDMALTMHLDSVARQRRYDNRITCAVRAGYAGPFQAEGQAFAAWMDAQNAKAYTLLAEVQAGTRPLPETTQALIDELDPMVWPT